MERIPFLILAITNTFSQLKDLPGLTIWCCRLAEAYAGTIAVPGRTQTHSVQQCGQCKTCSHRHMPGQVSQNKGKLYTIDVTFILVTLHLIIIVIFFEHLMLAVQVQ